MSMDYKKLLENQDFSSPAKIAEWMNNAISAIGDLTKQTEEINITKNAFRKTSETLADWVSELKARAERAERERDEAIECCRGYCSSCLFINDCAKHDMNDASSMRWYYGDCEDWEWKGTTVGENS